MSWVDICQNIAIAALGVTLMYDYITRDRK
ncbi:Uncharacterised protein [Mycobacteroides abscessus subsp. massiliense]|uniref:Uncharacterized protein n=1 Tax=Mycobacteroides abscessus subsp. massiliense TaxID=1962118 RepID=A0A1U0V368_9MYCO|nr:Uncharacterised protein [Mycobacteroides abscessus subsp. massiliense]SKT00535.1 Uncharacterised protein [Mycobacteroides abscessus subsp. massiliense]SKT11920.1 Uncharacterised protein [Mycobacteroides abscessus subsp. massiliense]SKX18067.1 Uncharacterised protein [Mycobacteroides abscessus subsp. massiliense]